MSAALAASDVAALAGGELVRGAPEARFEGVSIDTRSLRPGELYVAIRGPNHDGHAFLERAAAAGAAGALVERGRAPAAGLPDDFAVIAVADTTPALGALAAGHRARFDGPVVAITGSNGKTTTKEMCAAILSVPAPCLKNPGNLNNAYGLPLALLARTDAHRAVVVEIGMNRRGEIAPLAAIARPTVGAITNAGTAHIEFLGSREAIAQEKGDLVAALEPGATAVLNADDARVLAQAARTRARVVTFGVEADADVRAERVEPRGGGFALELRAFGERIAVEIAGLGRATLANAAAATAAALAAGARGDHVRAGLARYRPLSGRLRPLALARGVTLIDDSYNANPQSLALALESLAQRKGTGRGLAVLGSMGELGPGAARAHREAGATLAKLGVDYLFALGEHAEALVEGARAGGLDAARVHVGRDHAETGARVLELLRPGDWILVKGSRAMRMERVVEALSRAAAVEDGGAAAAEDG